MTDEERRQKKADARFKALLRKLGLVVTTKECKSCYGDGVWHDGGDCGYCDGAGELYEFTEV